MSCRHELQKHNTYIYIYTFIINMYKYLCDFCVFKYKILYDVFYDNKYYHCHYHINCTQSTNIFNQLFKRRKALGMIQAGHFRATFRVSWNEAHKMYASSVSLYWTLMSPWNTAVFNKIILTLFYFYFVLLFLYDLFFIIYIFF